MNHLVILNLGKGDCDRGCSAVVAQIWLEEGVPPMQVTGCLPPAPELGSLYHQWQQYYEALYHQRSWRRTQATESKDISANRFVNHFDNDFEIEEDESYVTDVSEAAFNDLCYELQHQLNVWLNSDSFRKIDRQLRT